MPCSFTSNVQGFNIRLVAQLEAVVPGRTGVINGEEFLKFQADQNKFAAQQIGSLCAI